MPSSHRVTEAHRPEPGARLSVRAGDLLAFERRETEWPGWIWCTDSAGRQAWVPERWVEIKGAQCRMRRAYDSRELSVRPGDQVEVLETESGWARVRTRPDEVGWVPLRCLSRGQSP